VPRPIDFQRYRRLRRFLVRTFLHALYWDVLLALPGLRTFRRPAVERWRRIARRYRSLATEMGGFLIKLGQFLSVRVDLLPLEITRELAALQDQVAPERTADMVSAIEEELERPLGAVFSRFDDESAGAASLAQVHRAALLSGEPVVVKVLRPGIERSVETDLSAVRLALRLLGFSRRIRRRVDLERLAEEIESTTRRELDLAAEGHNAERFAANFAGDGRVLIPAVHWPQSGRRVLTLEDVGYLKLNDSEALERAGIVPREVGKTLYRIYLQQIFIHSFVHADPHPGNLFVRPLPLGDEPPMQPGDAGPPASGAPRPGGRGFQIVFVDFGMVAEIPERLRGALREYVIGIGARDAGRVVRAYEAAGALLPGADLERIVEAHEALFDRFWGVPMGDLRRVALSQAAYFFHAYQDLLREVPFQLQVELLFVQRAVGLLSGITTQLDPELDLWSETVPFARRLAGEGWGELGTIVRELLAQVARTFRLPSQLENVFGRALAGTLTVRAGLSRESRDSLQRIERSIQRAGWLALAGGMVVAGSLFAIADRAPAPWLFGGAAIVFLAGWLRRG
jgi:predicted unusual protein kinase regulating ubiquinone biosynthesis (AarF/ABC1/UbiB family)